MIMPAPLNNSLMLQKVSATSQTNAPENGALQSTWGITRGCNRELSGSHYYPTERRQTYD